MNWSLHIPYRSRTDPLTDVVDASRELPTDEERADRGRLGHNGRGPLLDKIEKAAPAERRKMLDAARAGAGLPTTGAVEFEARFKMANHAARMKAGTDHRPQRLAYNETGGIIDLNERDDDIARERAREKSLRRVREDNEAVRAVEAAERAKHDDARDAAFRSELPPGFPG